MKRIDMHHHIVPGQYVKGLASIGITESYGQPIPDWSPEKSLSFMDKVGADVAMMSISTPGVSFADEQLSRDLARMCNDQMADVKQNNPGRYGGFVAVPLPDVEGAIEELRYGLDELDLDGVCLFTHYGGKYVGDKDFEDFFSELNRRKAVAFIHPTDPGGQYDPGLGMRNSLIEAPFETTRAVANMIFTGTTDRYPEIPSILSHGGGTIPYLAWRLALIEYGQKDKRPPIFKSIYDFLIKGGPESGFRILKNMYYDTALTTSPYALKALQELAGSKHIVFGSDYPFAAKHAPMLAKDLREYPDFSEEDFRSIDYGNGLRLFPSLELS
jgi:predicted TIM-barrel fold metal-dependent hydrolase